MKMSKILLFILIVLSLIGSILLTTIIHEAYHIYDMKGATSVCLNLGYKINDSVQNGHLIAFTTFDLDEYTSLSEYTSLREYSEKIAGYLNLIIPTLIGFIIGILFMRCKK